MNGAIISLALKKKNFVQHCQYTMLQCVYNHFLSALEDVAKIIFRLGSHSMPDHPPSVANVWQMTMATCSNHDFYFISMPMDLTFIFFFRSLSGDVDKKNHRPFLICAISSHKIARNFSFVCYYNTNTLDLIKRQRIWQWQTCRIYH